jgi:hypothetical protein
MTRNNSKTAVPTTTKVEPQPNLHAPEAPDDRYPGTFFRRPGVPIPGKTTWSIVR